MNYWKVILATVVIFGTGVLTGGLLVDHVSHAHQKNSRRAPAKPVATPPTNHQAPTNSSDFFMPRMAKEMGKQFVKQLNDTLKLTPEQREKIEKIIVEGQERNREIWTNVVPKMRGVMQEVNEQIRTELTPEQLKPFEELLKNPPRRPSGTNTPSLSRPASNPPPPAPRP